jgi:hypothetical protein
VNKSYDFDQRKAPTPSRCFHLKSRLKFISNFEFGCRKHRTIKGDAN